MPKPVCVKCQRFYRPHRNGVHILEGKPNGVRVPPGTSRPELWEPYKVWMADMWKCQGCGHELINGFGHSPLWQDFQPNMPEFSHKVNDC